MDPTKVLNNARYYVALAEECDNGSERHEYLVNAVRLYEAIDQHISWGGLLPDQWEFPKEQSCEGLARHNHPGR